MDAHELAEVAARREASGRPYLEFITVRTSASGSTSSRRASRTSSGRTPRTRSTTWSPVAAGSPSATRSATSGPARSCSCGRRPAPVPRHHRRADAVRRVRTAEGSGAVAPARRGSAGGPQPRTRAPAPRRDPLVVAEEHERVEPVRDERLESRGPRGELGRRVVVAAKSQVEERAGPADRGRRLVLGQLGRASAAPALRAPRTPRRRATTGPGTPSSAAGRAATRRGARPAPRRRGEAVRDPEQHGPEPLAELAERLGQPRHARRPARPERSERAAALGLDREPEVGRRRGEPGVDLAGVGRW